MDYTVEEVKGVTIINVNAKRAIAKNAKELKVLVFDLVEKKNVMKMVLDLSSVEFADSTFLGAIVSGLKKVTLVKGDIKILGLQPPVRAMFELTRLYKVFEIFDNKDDAIKSF